MQRGLSDNSKAVSDACRFMLCTHWLHDAGDDPIELLRHLDVCRNEVCEKITCDGDVCKSLPSPMFVSTFARPRPSIVRGTVLRPVLVRGIERERNNYEDYSKYLPVLPLPVGRGQGHEGAREYLKPWLHDNPAQADEVNHIEMPWIHNVARSKSLQLSSMFERISCYGDK